MIGVPGQLFKAVIGNLAAEVIAGHVFDFVGFVENDGGIFRQDAAEIVLLESQVGEKQMVIDDDEVGFLGALVHGGDKALVEVVALLPGAGVSARVEARPQIGIVGKKGELAAIAGFGELRPLANLAESIDLFDAFQHGLVGHLMHAGVAQEIRTALHHRDFQIGREMLSAETGRLSGRAAPAGIWWRWK